MDNRIGICICGILMMISGVGGTAAYAYNEVSSLIAAVVFFGSWGCMLLLKIVDLLSKRG